MCDHGDHAGSVDAVLDGEGDAVERTPELAPHRGVFGLPRPVHHSVGEGDKGIDPWVDSLDAIQVGLGHLNRGQGPVSYSLG